ncbi:MAG: hypothetical protein AABW79_02705 [Nanoarchaeota archaeon]
MTEFCNSDEHPSHPSFRETLEVLEGRVANARFGILSDSELEGLEIDVVANYVDTDVPDPYTLKYWNKSSIQRVYSAFGVGDAIGLMNRDLKIAVLRGEAWGIAPV